MRKLFPLLAALWLHQAVAGPNETVFGQETVRQTLVTWNAGTTTSKTRMMILYDTNAAAVKHKFYLDTSATGQGGAWRRIDSTADTCSNPFFIASDSAGSAWPVWQYLLWQTVRSKDKDSSTHVYRVQSRLRLYDNTTKVLRWSPWSYKGAQNGDANVTITDSILVANARVTTSQSQYALGRFLGVQARLCPDKVAGTAKQATDSIFLDSTFIFVR